MKDQEIQAQHHSDVEEHDAHCYEVHADASLFESGEKARSDLQTDTVDKEDQAQLLHEVDDFLLSRVGNQLAVRTGNVVAVDVTDYDADKQHESHAERNAAELNPAQLHAQTDHQSIDDDQVGNGTRICNEVC